MHVLVTGGAGFIGSHLAERCLAEGWRVTALDDLSTGAITNIEHLRKDPSFEYRHGDVLDKAVVAELVDSADVVFHLAAAVGVKLVMRKQVRSIRTNLHGTENVLECAAQKGKYVTLASTSEVYGKSHRLPFQEDDDLVLGATRIGRWSYAAAKAMDEWQAFAYGRELGLPLTVLRFFNTSGPRQTDRDGMVLRAFVRQALRGDPITVHGTGEQRRCLPYVGDVVEAVVRLAQTPEASGEVINIGNDQEVTINALAALVKEVTGSPSPVVHESYAKAYGSGFEDMQRRVPCLEKLQKLIGYRPTTSLETIIRRVIDYEWMRGAREVPRRAMAVAV